MAKHAQGPVVDFADEAELREYLHDWMAILSLRDWHIKAVLIPLREMKEEYNCWGHNQYNMVNKASLIQIASLKDKSDRDSLSGYVTKYNAEKTLVHELLHLKMNWVQVSNTYEGNYTDEMEHQALDEMAKALIMAKYGITLDWFNNF